MSDRWTSLPLSARHVEEDAVEIGPDDVKQAIKLPGFVEIGTYIEGVWVPFVRRKAPGLLADIERAKKAAAEALPPPPPPTPAA